MQTLLRNRLFLAVVSGHFALDILNSLGPVLLAVLAAPFALSNAQIGVALTLYTLISSLTQPLFGLLADRMRKPALLGGLALAWTALCYVAVAFAPTWPLLLGALLLGGDWFGLFPPGWHIAGGAGGPHHRRAGVVDLLLRWADGPGARAVAGRITVCALG